MDMYDVGYGFGYVSTLVVIVGLIVWAIVHNNRRSRERTLAAAVDLELLGRTVTLHTEPERAAELVARIAVASGRLTPTGSASPSWWVDGGHPVVALEHTSDGSTLGIGEVVVPLRSPDGANLWRWMLGAVEEAAHGAGISFSRSARRFVPGRQIDAYSATWVPG